MVDVIGSLERARRSKRLSQAPIAAALDVTQGHYSKVVTLKVPLTDALSKRMEEWLAANDAVLAGDDLSGRVRALAASIRRECMELMRIVDMGGPELTG